MSVVGATDLFESPVAAIREIVSFKRLLMSDYLTAVAIGFAPLLLSNMDVKMPCLSGLRID